MATDTDKKPVFPEDFAERLKGAGLNPTQTGGAGEGVFKGPRQL